MSGPALYGVPDTADYADFSGGGTVLAILNEVAGGRMLITGIRRRVEQGADRVVLVAPANLPSLGQIVAPADAHRAARSRVEVTAAVLAGFGIASEGAVFDPDPDLAVGDAIRAFTPREVLLSCLPDERFGVQLRDLVRYTTDVAGPDLPVTHIPVRIEADAVNWNVTHSLVVATRTVASPELVGYLKAEAALRAHRYTFICPPSGETTIEEAGRNLAATLTGLYEADIDATGQPMRIDPLAAVEAALTHFRIDDVIISTLQGGQSAWIEGGLLARLNQLTDKPVHHLEATAADGREPAGVLAGEQEQ